MPLQTFNNTALGCCIAVLGVIVAVILFPFFQVWVAELIIITATVSISIAVVVVLVWVVTGYNDYCNFNYLPKWTIVKSASEPIRRRLKSSFSFHSTNSAMQ